MQTSIKSYHNNFMVISDDSNIKVPKTIVHKKIYDGIEIGNQFIKYFYSSWTTNPDIFISDNIIKSYTKIKHNNITYEGTDFVIFLKSVATNGLDFSACEYEIIDSGSRQIYILVRGNISNSQGIGKFSQSFTLSFMGQHNGSPKSWALINSIFILD